MAQGVTVNLCGHKLCKEGLCVFSSVFSSVFVFGFILMIQKYKFINGGKTNSL